MAGVDMPIMPTLLGRAKSFGLRVADEIKCMKTGLRESKRAELAKLYRGVPGETLAGFLAVEELITLSMASKDSSDYKGAYKQRHFTTKLTELMGKRGLVLRSMESRSEVRKRRALAFMLTWTSLVLVAVPTALATSQATAVVDGRSLPSQVTMWLAVACTALTVLTPRSLCAPLFRGSDEVRIHRILHRIGQSVASRILGGEQQLDSSDKNCCGRIKQLRNYVFCFRATWALASISFLLIPSTVPITSLAPRIFVAVAAPVVYICSMVCAAGSCNWGAWDASEEDLAKLPRAKRWMVAAAGCLLEIMAEGAALIFFLFIFSGYITLTVIGEACPQLAFQLLSINAGFLMVIALSLTRTEITFFLTVSFQIYTWTEALVARVHKAPHTSLAFNNSTCPGQVWPWANVAVGSLCFIWALYEQLSAKPSRSDCTEHQKLQTKEMP